jgi:hypothetical protein
MKFFFLIFNLFLAMSVSAAPPAMSDADLQKWSQSTEWKKLLHYKKNSFGFERSLLDGSGFFFAKDGRTNALAELRATIEGMSSPDKTMGKYSLHSQCAFPARFQFLNEKMNLAITPVPCPKLDEFMLTFKEPETVSVIFSSAYPNNPASMFGHSFLKINSKGNAKLKDIGINFAAHVSDDENPFAFIYFGVMGGYVGNWSTENYYDKVRTYIQGENRDLWEYELNFTAADTKKLLNHLWELETNSYFDYYFFDENCSYQILAALEAVRPESDLTHHTIYVIPGESIKNLFRAPGLVKNVQLRPSAQRIVMQKYAALNEEEKKEFFALKENTLKTSSYPLAVETGMAYFDFLNVKKKGRLSDAEKAQQLGLLSQRAAMGPRPDVEARLKPIQAETRPDLGHDSYSLHLSQTARQRADHYGAGSTTNLKIKSAYHDLMNNDTGFKRYSHIDFPSIEFQYDSDLKSVRLNEINALSITSLPPVNFLSKAPAWKLESGLYTARDYGCLNCRHVFTEVGLGAATNFISGKNLIYGLATARGELYNELSRGYRYGPGLEVGTLFNPQEKLKFRLAFKQFWDVGQDDRSRILQNYLAQFSYSLARNYELRNSFNFIYPLDHPELRNTNISVEFIYFFN